jgi:PleD family two-component response regulator
MQEKNSDVVCISDFLKCDMADYIFILLLVVHLSKCKRKRIHVEHLNSFARQGKISKQNKRMKRILLVDDEYDISLAMKLVLEENGFKVDSFTGASEALENFRTGLYDLVILDVKMPEMDGFSLYEKIKKLDDKVVICFLTAADYAYYEISKKSILASTKIVSFINQWTMNPY